MDNSAVKEQSFTPFQKKMNALKTYFSKPAKNLSCLESATLAGIISSPARYSPVTKSEACIKRRNLVLNEMKEDKFLTSEDYNNLSNQPLSLNVNTNKSNNLNTYAEAALDEAINILKLPAKQISIGGYKIYTNMNEKKQNDLENVVKNSDLQNNNYALISINSNNGEIQAYIGNADYKILDHKRQPGSAIKPILVYAPALNEDIIPRQGRLSPVRSDPVQEVR